ncbi:MAG TPA: hypothetical protein VGF49_12020, partial [Candidatus Solibacter sp.]
QRLAKREPAAAPLIGVESVLAALFLGTEAMDRMWALQTKEGKAKGAWVLEKAPRQEGSNAYATALVTLVLQRTQGPGPKSATALGWLRVRQDPEGGYWSADSMNKQYPADSMEIKFMRDAATAFASLALLEASN